MHDMNECLQGRQSALTVIEKSRAREEPEEQT